MSFPRYPAYKDSAVEWLGQVPGHWSVRSIKHIVSTRITDGPHETPTFLDEGIPFVSAEAIATGMIAFSKIRGFISESDHARYSQKYRPRIGDIYMVKSGATTGVTAIVETEMDFNIWSPLAAIRCGNDALPRFVLNFLRSKNFQEGVALNWSFGTQQNIGMGVIENLAVPLPPLSDQKKIATFLDRETAKIDALAAEYRTLIELLKEKRQAVISHAVTKGLDQTTPMMDSGVKWLGEVPAHWDVCAVRRVITELEQGWSPACYAREADENEWGVLKAGCVNGGVFRPFENKALPPELVPEHSYEVRTGDVLMSRASGSPELVGSAALVKVTRDRLMLSDKIFRLKFGATVIPAFFVAAANSRALRAQIENALSGGGGMADNLPQSSLLAFTLAVPPLDEQEAISAALDGETTKLDALIAESEQAISFLQERRTALISAAVTGKIDVRGRIEQEAA